MKPTITLKKDSIRAYLLCSFLQHPHSDSKNAGR